MKQVVKIRGAIYGLLLFAGFAASEARAAGFSLLLQGNTAYAMVDDASGKLNVTNDWTIEIWFKDQSGPSYHHGDAMLLMKGDSNVQPDVPFFLRIGNGLLSAGLRQNWTWQDVTYNLETNGVSFGTWHHAAATFQRSTLQLSIYLDGNPVAQGTLGAPVSTGTDLPLMIARAGLSGEYYHGNQFSGLLDDCRIWNIVRTPAQIASAYTSELAGTPAGLVANWKFDDGSGTTAVDSAPSPLNVGLFGSADWTADTPGSPQAPPVAPGRPSRFRSRP